MQSGNQHNEALAIGTFAEALRSGAPIVAILGQTAGWSNGVRDPVLRLALQKAEREGNGWSDLLSREALPADFYQWVAERFSRRTPSESLATIADIPLSAVFTSSIDPGLPGLFGSNGRETEPILLGQPVPAEIRSIRRPPLFYLFVRAGAGTPELEPPITRQALAQRRLLHSSQMLLNVKDSATALGLIVIDGYSAKMDWLAAEDLLAAISGAPKNGVIWFGEDDLEGDNAETLHDLIEARIVIRGDRSLGETYALLRASGDIASPERWDEPELISLHSGQNLVISPHLRLMVEATAQIVDNSWTGFLPPFEGVLESSAFHSFHAANIGPRALVEGIRRGYAFKRDFEDDLYLKVEKALSKHHDQKGALVLHGQSGTGKTVAMGRLAIRARAEAKVAVLMVSGTRIPLPGDVSPFLEVVARFDGVTLLIIDANNPSQRYDDLLAALRSSGHKVVVVGTSYRLDDEDSNPLLTCARSSLSRGEQAKLGDLMSKFARSSNYDVKTDHALAKFYWSLPESRGGIADGLSKEARALETALRIKGTRPRRKMDLGALAVALVAAGYGEPEEAFFPPSFPASEIDLTSPAARVIDYVMTTSRLYRAVPINLLLRTVLLQKDDEILISVDVETLRDLFVGEDMFRWQYGGKDESELLVSARLQLEAELVCNRRLGTPHAEATRIIELISKAYNASREDGEESHFVTEIVFALGPDGPAGERYKDAYLDVARCLTDLRKKNGVLNARLILQESALRRAYVRTHDLAPDKKAMALVEATQAVDYALTAIDVTGSNRLYAAKRTKEYLLTERAATYGYLALDSAQTNNDDNVVWSSYRAARDAIRVASGRVSSYQPLDISLWVPIRVLREAPRLPEVQRAELLADIRATLDVVDPTTLPKDQAILFNKQRVAASELLQDVKLSEAAFSALEAVGSAVGFYLKARAMAPTRPLYGETGDADAVRSAERTIAYLMSVYEKVSHDPRCLQLLIAMEWLKATGRWIFRGLRQPIPFDLNARERIRTFIADLRLSDPEAFSPQYRYLEAVLTWLDGDPKQAMASWRNLARDTEYVDARRVVNRNTISDATGKPIVFSGVIVKALGPGRWSLRVPELDRDVDLQETDFPRTEIALGRTVRNFSISFNYRGTIADVFHHRGQ